MSSAWLILGGAVLVTLGGWPLAPSSTVSPEAEIVVEREPLAEGRERITVTAVYTGAGAGLSYRFETVKDGGAGRSESVQRGEIERAGTLATSSVVAGADDQFSAHLVVLQGGRVTEDVRWERAGQ